MTVYVVLAHYYRQRHGEILAVFHDHMEASQFADQKAEESGLGDEFIVHTVETR